MRGAEINKKGVKGYHRRKVGLGTAHEACGKPGLTVQ